MKLCRKLVGTTVNYTVYWSLKIGQSQTSIPAKKTNKIFCPPKQMWPFQIYYIKYCELYKLNIGNDKWQIHLVTSCIFTDNHPIIKMIKCTIHALKNTFCRCNSNPNSSILRKWSETHKGHGTWPNKPIIVYRCLKPKNPHVSDKANSRWDKSMKNSQTQTLAI